jgi:hypothetical protein
VRSPRKNGSWPRQARLGDRRTGRPHGGELHLGRTNADSVDYPAYLLALRGTRVSSRHPMSKRRNAPGKNNGNPPNPKAESSAEGSSAVGRVSGAPYIDPPPPAPENSEQREDHPMPWYETGTDSGKESLKYWPSSERGSIAISPSCSGTISGITLKLTSERGYLHLSRGIRKKSLSKEMATFRGRCSMEMQSSELLIPVSTLF